MHTAVANDTYSSTQCNTQMPSCNNWTWQHVHAKCTQILPIAATRLRMPLHLKCFPCRSHYLGVIICKYIMSYPTCAANYLCDKSSSKRFCSLRHRRCQVPVPLSRRHVPIWCVFCICSWYVYVLKFQFERVLVAFPGHHKLRQCSGESSASSVKT